MEGISLTRKSSIDLTCLSFSYSLRRCHQCMVTCGMGYNEKISLDEFKTHEIVLYVDGIIIICLFACVKDAAELFTFLNSRHPNIKFIFKKEKGNKIPFLHINKTNQFFCTSVFWKSMSIGLCTIFLGFTPFSYKIRLITTLIH